ncbi:MAG: cation diffusion facilitator family transporter [Armatimonadetes bacterium]|nr:cation diffusion facilitator family transporter [Armatimonadota bacterium]NIM23387.1 cation diffusion facilitator family transporter [Armatimonadota bacterium]NIM67252.1 cation diffusion facilitator family transporter [Armatimonadota bacterium]NIM75750.1 cation diffusion facilitator family transporter [Armatimonadota bacterium]NIN05438.1 cation diffusion facilitator family transporter [Armatimonadota bacterium]
MKPGARAKAALLSIISNTCLVIAKLVTAFATGSVSILSEALHSGMDLIAAFMAFFSVKAADKPADRAHPFGHGKFESISGAAEGILILVAAGLIIHSSVLRIISDTHRLEFPLAGALVMAVSVIVNIIVSGRLMRIAKETNSIALEADAWHLRTDVYTSAGVFAGMAFLAVAERFAWGWALHIDGILAIGIALVILRAGWDITCQSYHHLVDRGLPEKEHQELVNLLRKHYSRFVNFHSLRTRLAGNQRHIDFHLLVPPEMSLEQAHDLCNHLEDEIHALLPRSEVLIHVEPASEEDSSETPISS